MVVPGAVCLARGSAEGPTELNAFDNALRDAGIHDLNLVRVSSILPEGALFVDPPSDLPVGTLVPAVYARIVSAVPGELVSACVGAGIGPVGGVLMEYAHHGTAADAERLVTTMIEEAFRSRRWTCEGIRFATSEHRVERHGCAVAAALLLDGPEVESREVMGR